MNKVKIMIVDDEEKIRQILTFLLEDENYSVKAVENGDRALSVAAVYKPDLVLMDQNMPGKNGIDTMLALKKFNPAITVIIITAFGEVSLAVEAIKNGAYDYLEKPFDNDKLLMLIRRAVEHKRMTEEISSLQQAVSAKKSFDQIIGISSDMKQVIAQAQSVVDTDASVLLQGESGTGKEILAQAIHNASKRKGFPMVAVNCGALPYNLIESELFGHEKGAFTDAREAKPGKFEQANGGTLFLDELGELPLDAQVKLLRVLEDKKVTRIGGLKAIPVNVRIISATNKNLEERVQKGAFRLDLYYRLNVFAIHIPSLRSHPEDIPLLVDHFISVYNSQLNTRIRNLSNQAMDVLKKYSWPGNVRDLQNCIQSAMILAREGTISTEFLPMRVKSLQINELPTATPDGSLNENIKNYQSQMEKELIIEALTKCNYSRSKAAEMLKISRKTLYNKMRFYDL